MSDKLKITINLTRNENGTCSRSYGMEGEGFHYYEVIGLLQMVVQEMYFRSVETAKELPEGRISRLIFNDSEPAKK